ncbi:hypothetical protein CsatB_003776 [Cannabis sativa]
MTSLPWQKDKYQKYLFKREQELAYIKAQATARRALRIGALLERRTPRPKPVVPVPNIGAPDASTSGSVARPMDELLATLVGAHSPDASPPPAASQLVTPGGSSSNAPSGTIVLVDEEEVLEEVEEGEEEQSAALERKRKGKMVEEEPLKLPRRVDTPAPSHDSGIPSEVEEYTMPHDIVLTLIPGDEERQNLQIAKYNYALDEYSRGHAEVEALKRILREEQQNTLNEEAFQNPWDLNMDPLTDWFNRFLGPTLAPFASEMTSEFVFHLTQFLPKWYAACASLNSVYQVQDINNAMAAEEADRWKALAKAKLEEEAKQREAQAEAKLREEAQQREVELEARHHEALKAEGEARARRELWEAKEAMDEMATKVKSLEELHQADLQSKANLVVELKELKDFRDQALKKAKRDELLTPVSCKHCVKRFDDGLYMAWQSNGQSIKLDFYPKPEEALAKFWEKKKKLDAMLEVRRSPHLPPRID